MPKTIKAKVTSGAIIPLEHFDIEEGMEVTVSIEDSPSKVSTESGSGKSSVESRGQAIYERMKRNPEEELERGEFVVIDVGSGDYEIDSDDADATARLMARRPSAITYAVRVGHPAAYRMGTRFSHRPQ